MRDLFPDLDPPAGGLASLRTRLESDRRRRIGWAVAASAVVAVLLFLASPRPQPIPNDPGLAAFGLYQPTAPVEPSGRTAAHQVAVTDANTVFYRVASLD